MSKEKWESELSDELVASVDPLDQRKLPMAPYQIGAEDMKEVVTGHEVIFITKHLPARSIVDPDTGDLGPPEDYYTHGWKVKIGEHQYGSWLLLVSLDELPEAHDVLREQAMESIRIILEREKGRDE